MSTKRVVVWQGTFRKGGNIFVSNVTVEVDAEAIEKTIQEGMAEMERRGWELVEVNHAFLWRAPIDD